MKLPAHLASLLLLFPALSHAADADIRFGGFGTLGIAHSDNPYADYRADQPFAAKGPGRSVDWDAGLDSKLGLQIDGNLTQQLSAVVQILSERQSDNGWQPQFEWANLRYQLTPQWRFSLGRVMAPVLMVSDWRKVSYAQTMVRPPAEVYTLNPITHLNGIDVEYRTRIGAVGLQAQGEYGNTHLSMNWPDRKQDYKIRQIVLGRVNAEYGGSTFSISGMHMQIDGSADIYTLQQNLLQTLAGAGVSGAAQIDDAFRYRDTNASNYSLGYQYDRDQWLLRSEIFSNRAQGNVYADYGGWYVSSAYRVQRFSPYLAYAKVWNKENYTWPMLDSGNLAPPLAGMAASVNAINRGLEAGTYGQHTWTVGLRWDPMEKLALKLQLENIDKAGGRRSTFTNPEARFVDERQRIKLFSATLDFIF